MTSSTNSNNYSVLKPAGLVSEQVLEYLLTEMSNYAAASCLSSSSSSASASATRTSTAVTTTAASTATASTTTHMNSNNENQEKDEEHWTVAAEMAAAKLERLGWSVGYRWTERLAQNKTWNTAVAAVVPSSSTTTSTATTASTTTSTQQQQQQDSKSTNKATAAAVDATTTAAAAAAAAAVAAQQLEAVKFLCKEVWTELFRKQMDKLQTNHRGVFVLKDLNLQWLSRFPAGTEESRVAAMRFLAFPCGLIRGALANLGIPAVVSCDFLADGQNMSACSFNIKVK